jgi:hypothetical protein
MEDSLNVCSSLGLESFCKFVGYTHMEETMNWCKIWEYNFTQCVHDSWIIICACNGWAHSIKMHAFRWEVLDPVREVFSLNFKLQSHFIIYCLFHFDLCVGLMLCYSNKLTIFSDDELLVHKSWDLQGTKIDSRDLGLTVNWHIMT